MEQLLEVMQDSLIEAGGIQFIKTPFLNTLYFVGQEEMLNTMYTQSKQRFEQQVELGNYGLAIALIEKPFRIDVLQDLYETGMIDKTEDTYWEAVFDTYTSVEFTSDQSDLWLALMDGASDNMTSFMTDDERSIVEALPEVVTVYRGAKDGVNETGISFSLDYDKAEWFAERFDSDESAVVIEAQVRKEDILAYTDRRGESEVIFDSSKAVSWKVNNLDYDEPTEGVCFLDKVKDSIEPTGITPEPNPVKTKSSFKIAM